MWKAQLGKLFVRRTELMKDWELDKLKRDELKSGQIKCASPKNAQ